MVRGRCGRRNREKEIKENALPEIVKMLESDEGG